jgi:LuxR family transcriptional regulator, maltose regulon positive regulatory protein
LAYGGVSVRREKIIDAIWADEEGDRGRKAFEAAVHRLRRLIGDHETIGLKEGRVGLDPNRSFVDIWAFEGGVAANASEEERLRALNLYRGDFLAGEDHLPWAEPMRRRLRARFLEATEAVAAARAERGDFDGALNVWRAAVAACPEAESACLALIRRQRAMGLTDLARETARQLRISLAAAGRAPSKASLFLFRSLDN